MRKRLLSGIGLAIAGLTQVAFAIDYDHYTKSAQRYYKDTVNNISQYFKPTSDWTGFYAGGNVGFGWGTQDIQQSANQTGPDTSLAAALNANAIRPTLANRPSGYLGGIQIGYNYQYTLLVVGAEADYQTVNINDGGSTLNRDPSFLAFSSTGKQQLKSLATLRGRIGMAPSNNLLFYLTAGYAGGKEELSGSITTPGCTGFCGSNTTTSYANGWIGGLGVEYAFVEDWSIKTEYLYYDMSSISQKILDPAIPGAFLAQKLKIEGNLVRVGLNYKFA